MTFIDQYLLLVMIALPFAGALIIAFVPRDRPQDAHRLVRVVATVGLPLSVYAFFAYDSAQGGLQLTQQFEWLPSLGVTFSLGLTGITAPLFLLTGVVFFCGVLVSWNVQDRSKEFFLWLMLLVTGVYGVFASVDLFFFFFFYELAVVPMYLLIGVWGSTTDFGAFVRTKEYGALKLVLYLVAGSVLVWVAIIAMWVEGGHTLSMLELEQASFSRTFQIIFFPLIMVGFGILAGLWPFHTWSPDGHVAAPTAVSMLHAGVLMKLGAFGILRVGMVLLPEGAQVWAPVLIGLGTVNVMYGAVSALAQRDLKYVVGYSSVSHMGYVLMGLATLNVTGINGAVLQMFSHGIMTALFFALVGFIYDRAHVRDIGVLGGPGQADGSHRLLLRRGRARVPGPSRPERIRRRVPSLPGHVPDVPGGRRVRRHRRGDHSGLHPPPGGQGLLWAPGPPLGGTDRRHAAGAWRHHPAGVFPGALGPLSVVHHEGHRQRSGAVGRGHWRLGRSEETANA